MGPVATPQVPPASSFAGVVQALQRPGEQVQGQRPTPCGVEGTKRHAGAKASYERVHAIVALSYKLEHSYCGLVPETVTRDDPGVPAAVQHEDGVQSSESSNEQRHAHSINSEDKVSLRYKCVYAEQR